MSLQKFLLSFLIYRSLSGQPQCNQDLMQSFDIPTQPNVVDDSNSICSGIINNCCSYRAQLDIFKKWNVKKTDQKIRAIYTSASRTLSRLFDALVLIEAMALEMKPYASDIKNSNCLLLTQKIQDLSIGGLREKIESSLGKSISFLVSARSGFYCSLCDADSHLFYNDTTKIFQTSASFCASLAGNLLNYYLFKYKHFPRISRLYTQWAVSCDLRGNFDPKPEIKSSVKFYTKPSIGGDLENCANNYNKPGAVLGCQKLCQRFNPVKLDKFIEGEIDKIDALSVYLTQKTKRIRRKFNKEKNKAQGCSGSSVVPTARRLLDKRILQNTAKNTASNTPSKTPSNTASKAPSKTASKAPSNTASNTPSYTASNTPSNSTTRVPIVHLNEFISEVSNFNINFKTVLVPPIIYDFKIDYQIKFNRGFYDSLFELGGNDSFNLLNFKNKVSPDGISYSYYGAASHIDIDSARVAFAAFNPITSSVTFEEFLEKLK